VQAGRRWNMVNPGGFGAAATATLSRATTRRVQSMFRAGDGPGSMATLGRNAGAALRTGSASPPPLRKLSNTSSSSSGSPSGGGGGGGSYVSGREARASSSASSMSGASSMLARDGAAMPRSVSGDVVALPSPRLSGSDFASRGGDGSPLRTHFDADSSKYEVMSAPSMSPPSYK